ncbi:MAG: ribose-5-phosphate isomerase A [Solirubrobacteraceae bacterium]
MALTTVAHLLPALAERGLSLRCVTTSLATEHAARTLGLAVEPFNVLDRLDIAIDGADQVTPEGWLIKGGRGAHMREKIVAGAAERFVVIGSSDKLTDVLTPPVPVELLTIRRRWPLVWRRRPGLWATGCLSRGW